MGKKYKFEDAVLEFSQYGYTVLITEKEYKGIAEPIRCLCRNEHVCISRIYSLRKGMNSCNICKADKSRNDLRTPFIEVVTEAAKYGYIVTMLERDYKSIRNGVEGLCPLGHECEHIDLATLRNGKGCCVPCGIKKRALTHVIPYDEAKERYTSYGYKLCIDEKDYVGVTKKYPGKCSEGHDCKLNMCSLLSGYGCCKICGIKKGSRKFCNLLMKY